MIFRDQLPYRQSTLAIVVDGKGKFLIVNKMSYKENEWAFPGGGVDEGEAPEKAIKRELEEELLSEKFEIVGEAKYLGQYEWPDKVIEDVYKNSGKHFRGTVLTQFLVKFTGLPGEVGAGDGIRKVKWVNKEELPSHLVFPNQWENAKRVIEEFERAQI